MFSARRLLRTARPWARRLLGALVLGLQAAVAGLAAWEPRAELRLGVHTEQDGTNHVGMHNEATCALCSARAQSSLPTLPEPTLVAPQQVAVIAALRHDAPSVAEAYSLHSRAPPSFAV